MNELKKQIDSTNQEREALVQELENCKKSITVLKLQNSDLNSLNENLKSEFKNAQQVNTNIKDFISIILFSIYYINVSKGTENKRRTSK